ncbi:hypothetical protein [Sinomonas sp. R1AF57]|uniref:hypothetical protein n=1 Tax=Sinomonas sp. R1AF57 TaxID=2020377 RepID=UPI000B5EB463|nr:hypothetical protein [Sinomonas sp. R1AF57]ASN53182.1 hypothetical protein CGQ25_14655 [Sinomonas sp. R1AF57]
MPKSRTRKPKNTRPKQAVAPNVVQRRARNVALLVDSVTPEYIAWATGGEPDMAAFAAQQLNVVKGFLTIIHADLATPTSFRMDPRSLETYLEPYIEDAATLAEAEGADEDEAIEDQRYVVGTLVDWLSFLEETGRWVGTAEELEDVAEQLDAQAERLGGIVDASPLAGLPEATDEESRAFATDSPFVRHARQLLEWLGEGREVDADGSLPTAALTEVAGPIGSEERALRVWQAMLAAELVELDEGSARPGEGAADLGGDDAMGHLEAQFLATEIVAAACSDGAPGTLEGETGAVLATILNAGLHQEPFPLEDVASLGTESGDDLDVEEELGPDAAERLKGLGEALLSEIRELEALGLLDTSDGMVAVPVAALDAVYDALMTEEELGLVDEDFEARELDET